MHRRRLLNPKELPKHIGSSFRELNLQSSPQNKETSEFIRISRRAMATQFEVFLPTGTPDAIQVGEFALGRIDSWEEKLSVYRENSEITLLNKLGYFEKVPLDPRIYKLLELADKISRNTGGGFDITTGKLIKLWGFFKGPKRLPDFLEIEAALAETGNEHLQFEKETNSVKFNSPNIEINLGAIGKGFALDQTGLELTAKFKMNSYLMHGGYSSILAGAAPPNSPKGWQISIRHPWANKVIGNVYLRTNALGISATTYQHFEKNGRKYGHILNPKTGYPASGIASCAVCAPNATLADALSTAFFVLGKEAAEEYCKRNKHIGAVILPDDPNSEVFIVGKIDVEL